MNFDEIRKKHGLGTKEEEETKEKTTSAKMSYSDIAKKHGVSFDVDENYLNDFIKSANEFSSVDEDSAYAAWNRLGLGTKASEVRGWLYHNKNAYSADDYKSLSDTVDSFVNLGSYFSNWDTEEAYKTWYEKAKKQEEERAAVFGADDFEEYLQRGKETGSDTHFETIGWENDTLNLFTNINNDYIIAYREDPSLYAKNFSTTSMSAYADQDAQFARYMTDDEYKTYAYYYGKYGRERAREYLSSIEETLNGRIAGTLVESVGDNTATKMVFGMVAGLDQFRSGMESLFSKEDYIAASPTQMASGQIRESLSESGAKLPEWMGGGSVGQLGYDMVTTTSNMLPSIMASTVANVIAPGSGAVIGAGLLGASASGNAYASMLNLGYDKNQARAYSLLVGASEAGLQYALGGIGKLGGKVTGNAISKFVSQFDNAIARTAIKLGGNMASEGLEEAIQSVLEPLFKSIATGEEFEGVNWAEVIYSGLMGALSAGILESGSTISSEVNTYQQGKALKETGTESVDRLVSLGQQYASNTVAYQLAGKVNENTGAYTIGRLLNEVGATLSEQNKTDIANALVGKGMTEADAKTISKWLGKAVDGGYFTKGQIAALESNEVISSVFQDVIINQNSTVNQRIQGYNESLHALANEMSRGNTVAEPTEAQQTSAEPTAMLSKEEFVRRVAEATGMDATAVAQGFARQANETPVTENTPVEENATEGKFEASERGKAKIGDTEVTIKEIASIKDGEMILRLEDDSTVNAKDVEYGSSAEALIYENVVDMNLNAATANAFVNGYDPSEGLSAQEYVLGFREAYRYGGYGFPVQEMSKNGFSAKLSQTQRSLAYDLGKTDMKYKVSAQQAKIASTGANNSEKNASKGAKKGKVHYADGVSTKGLTDRQKASLKGLERLAEALGVEFHIFESEVGEDGKRKGANGWFDPKDGSIHIDLHAGLGGEGTILFTASHELTHFIREWSPEKFKVFADFLLEQYGKKGISVDALVRNQIAKAKRKGRDIDFDTAYEEVIADSCESMLADGDIMQKLAELKSKDKTLWEKIKSFITDLVAKIKAAYAGLSPDSIEGRYVAEMLDVATNLKTLFTDALVDAGESYSEIREALGEGSVIEVNENGEFTVGKTKDGDLLFNDRTYDEGGRDTLRATLEAEGYSDADIKAALAIIDGKHELVKKFGKLYTQQDIVNKATLTTDLKNGLAVLSAIVSNGDYPVNIDLSMVCKKRVAYQNVINSLCKSGLINQATLDSLAIAEINKVLGKYGFETACLGCFVESRRIRIQEWAQTICKEWNGIVDKMVGKGNAKAFGFANETFVKDLSDAEVNALSSELDAAYERDGLRYGRTTVVKKMEQLLREVPSLRKHLSVADLITPTGRTNIKSISSELNSLIACRYGSNTPKIVQDFNPYNHELAQYGKVPKGYDTLRDYLYAIGGARMQSFSDFIVENWFDYCQIVADLSARKLPMHTYTKEISLAKLFGMTGIKVNMSLIPDIDRSLGKEYAGLTKNAKGEYELIFADKDRFKATGGKSYMQSINFADAVALQEDPRYSSNVGTIAVGISDNHIRMMLSDPRIRMIIPYHSSGMNPIFAHLVGTDYYKDYTNFQNTGVAYLLDSNGNKKNLKLSKTQVGNITSGFEFNKVLQELGDARATAQAYLDWCADASKHKITINGQTYTAVLTPKFSEFADHENYYKLLEDFNTYDSITEQAAPQGDVQQIYPEDFDSILEDEIRSRDNYRKKQEPKWESAMGEIEDYLKTHKKADTIAYAKEHGIKLSKKDMKLSDRDSDRDSTYMDAVNRGDMDTAQKMVDEAAKEWGAITNGNARVPRPLHLYHGTGAFGFTQFRDGRIYATVAESVAAGYNRGSGLGRVRSSSHKYIPNDGTVETAIKNAKNVLGATLTKLDDVAKRNIISKADNILKDVANKVSKLDEATDHGKAAELFEYLTEKYGEDKTIQWTNNLDSLHYMLASEYTAEEIMEDGEWLAHDLERYHEWKQNLSELWLEEREAIKDSTLDKVFRYLLGYEYGDALIDIEYGLGRLLDDRQKLVNPNGNLVYLDDIVDGIEMAKDTGIYDLYGHPGEKPLIIDEGKRFWDAIPFENGFRSTDYIVKWAKENRYTSVLFKTVLDPSSGGSANVYADEWVFFDSNQVKSADPVTYDDNGNVIPLSERFNSKNNDIRYSDRDTAERAKEYFGTTNDPTKAGYMLADGTMLKFRNEGNRLGWDQEWFEEFGEHIDHHVISEVYGNQYDDNPLAAINKFISEGNVRLVIGALAGSADVVEISDKKAPTRVQLDKIYELAEQAFAQGKKFGVSYAPENWDESGPYEQFSPEVSPSRVIGNIKYYYANGEVRGGSGIYRYSDRDPDSFSNRSLLANALESVAQNDIERAKLAQYKGKLALIEAEQAKLAEVKKKANEIRFTKGRTADETKRMKDLDFEANQIANRINTYDRQLLNLESTKALKGVLDREKKMAYKKAEQKGRDALKAQREKDAKVQRELLTRYQDARKKGVEGRRKTEMRHKIKSITSELDTLLRRPTAKKHIKEELRAEVADALLAINMDTVGADERVARYNEMIAKAKDPDIIEELTKTRDHIQLQGDNLKEKLAVLHNAYEKIKASDDIELSMSYQEVIRNSIKAVTDKVGNTSIRDMTLEQLEMVYDLFSMIRKTIRNANKAFNEQKGLTIMQMAEAVCDQVRTVGGQPYKRNVVSLALQREGWHLLKPYVAFRTIGSVTLTNLYKNLRNGEDTFYGDVKEAQAFIEDQYEKHGYKSWDMKETKSFTAKSGKTFELNLEQMMTLYAYYQREKSHKHIMEGGIVFEDSVVTEKNKWGVPIKYEVTTKDAFNLSEETFKGICDYLEENHKDVVAFVKEMQAYLSDTMGAKGNEVSMELLGVKLFKEEFYLPIKSSQYYMNFTAEEAGEVKLKSPAFSKETVPYANNPIVLHKFTDLWAEHINDMSMYHSFVLALEDFTRVYNYKTKTDNKVETMDTKATLETAYPGATNYINKFLKDMNGGVRSETVGWAEKLTSLAKKGSVLGSASVAIQQPSAVMRAMAMVNPKHFVATTAKSFNLAKHKQDWEELKKYAPIAGIKEMGRFDVGVSKGTVDWIKSNETMMGKIDDVIGFAPEIMDEITWVSIWNAVKRETVHNRKDLRPNSEEFLKVAGERFTDVISLTQVYDSVFSRSDLMRNKSLVAKWLTSFMAEPTTTLNMLIDAYVQGKRTGSKKGFVKTTSLTTGAIVSSIVVNALLKSIVMAARDDDEDESYAEKYLEHFVGDLKDNLNPLTLIPVVKDVLSIFDGYDVERMDMALVSDLKKAIEAFNSDNKTAYDKWSGLIGAISAFFGVPVKNVERDIRATYNVFFGKRESTTKQGLLDAISEGLTGKSDSNGQQLYEAMLKGDSAQIERVKGRFDDDAEANSAIRAAIKEAYTSGSINYETTIDHLVKYGGMEDEDDAYWAIDRWDYAVENGSTEDYRKYGDFYTAVETGKNLKSVIKEYMDNGVSEKTLQSQITSHFKDTYTSMSKSERTSLKGYLRNAMTYCGMTTDEANTRLQYWDFLAGHPGIDAEESWIAEYYADGVSDAGISVEMFVDYRNKVKGETKKQDRMAVINSLPISTYQKDALYHAEGWSANTIWKAPWH